MNKFLNQNKFRFLSSNVVLIIVIVTGSWLILLAIASCATRDPSSNIYPKHSPSLPFQAPEIELYEVSEGNPNQPRFKSPHDRPKNSKSLAVAVAISGGGERAGNFAVGALLGLESLELDNKNGGVNALQEIDYFSTVSGGGMAVAAYFTALYSHYSYGNGDLPANLLQKSLKPTLNGENISDSELDRECKNQNVAEYYKNFDNQITDPCTRRHLERGHHGNMFRAFSNFRTLFTPLDRGDLLEETFAKESLGRDWNCFKMSLDENCPELTLGDVFIPWSDTKRSPRFPFWVANATVLENGAIFPFTPDILKKYKVNSYIHLMRKVHLQESEDHFIQNIPLSLGMTASGNFPTAIPPQTLGTKVEKNQYLHLIDGGVADNIGMMSAISLLRQEPNGIKKKVLIIIDAYTGTYAPYSKEESAPNAFQVYNKLPFLPLDSLWVRNKVLLGYLEKSTDTDVINLSFDGLYIAHLSEPYAEDIGKARILLQKLEANFDLNSEQLKKWSKSKKELAKKLEKPVNDLTPFELARGVSTNYNVILAEQQFLIAAGRYLVMSKYPELEAALRSE